MTNGSTGANPVVLRVIIAESSSMVREGLRQMLAELEGVSVVGEAVNGASLERLLRSTQARLVLLDVDLPGPDVLGTLSRLTADQPGLLVIALSQLRSPVLDQRWRDAGAALVLRKAGGLERLASAVVGYARGARGPGPTGRPASDEE